MLYSLNFRKKYAQIDKQMFFDFYGLSLLSDDYLEQNPYAKEYRDTFMQQMKEIYVPLITKMVYSELSKHTGELYDWRGWQEKFNITKPKDLLLDQLAQIYNEGDWEEEFGGPAWTGIVRGLQQLQQSVDAKQIILAIDHLNDIEHNSGLMFHDFPKIDKWYDSALEVKFNATPEQLIPRFSREVAKLVVEDLHLRGQEVIIPERYISEEEKKEIALNPSTHPEILVELAKEKNWEIRSNVASNPSTPPEVLAMLAKDKEPNTRWMVAENPSTPREVLVLLTKDKDEESVIAETAQDRLEKLKEEASFNLNMRKKITQKEEPDLPEPQVTKQDLIRLYTQEVKSIYDEELMDEIISKFIETLEKFKEWHEEYLEKIEKWVVEKWVVEKWVVRNIDDSEVLIDILQGAKTPQEKMIAIDRVINIVHSFGKYGEYLIKDFDDTFLDELSNLKISRLSMRKKAYMVYNDKGKRFEVIQK